MNREEFVKIIEDAIDNEIESYEFYLDASKKLNDPALKSTFKDLAEEELGHRDFLKKFLESNRNEISIDETSDYGVADTIEEPALSTDMSFSDAIGLAIKKEESAMEMYQGLGDSCTDNEKKELFYGLRDMERLHKTRLEEIYINVGYAEVW